MAASPRTTFEDEMQFRHAAMEWLAMRTHDGAEPMYYLDIEEFEYDGVRIPLRSRYKGIWKPASFGAALSFTTKYTKPGKERPYEDAVGDDGLIRYKWRDGGPDIPDNRALRAAMEAGLPLI
jgi:putative restriction endonuclease